jgi:NAD(P) transhydrogenase subunit beta
MIAFFTNISYLAAAACFILALKWLSAVPTARRGVLTGIFGMVFAVCGTLVSREIVDYKWIAAAMVIGTIIGAPLAWVPMTAVPQRTALSHAFGALAAALVGTAEYYLRHKGTPGIDPAQAQMIANASGTISKELASAIGLTRFTMFALALEVLLGYLTFTASLMACGKLQEILPTRPITFPHQNALNFSLFGGAILCGAILIWHPGWWPLFILMLLIALAFGVLLIIPIGGADMPTVISLLNSYAGLSAAAMGFVLDNKLLIVAGALDGSSGLILSIIMCRAMNRSFANVLFGAFGQLQAKSAAAEQRPYRSASAEEAADYLANANSVMVIPGYGMAVSQAQHKVRELYDALTKRGVQVRFAVHPVAGRMPGHMNVLLAEADIPYDKMLEMEEANEDLPQTDVALVIGANDVTNPVARTDATSPIYGMPILDVDKAKMAMVIKRSMNPGFAGIDNDLYYLPNTQMLFGDAKAFTSELVKAINEM